MESAAVVSAAAWQLQLYDVIEGVDRVVREMVRGVEPFHEVL